MLVSSGVCDRLHLRRARQQDPGEEPDRRSACERDGELSIDGRAIARALPVDGRGRRLAAWSGCGRLPNGEIFVLIPSVPTSLDGRYFGPTPIRAVIGRVMPLWLPGGRTR